MSKVKVLILSWYPADRATSGERARLRALAAQLAEDCDVSLLSFSPAEIAQELHPWHDVRAPPPLTREYRYTRGMKLRAALTLRSLHEAALGSRRHRRFVAEQISLIQPDIILVNQLPPASLLPRDARRRTVLDTHNAEYLRLIRKSRESGAWLQRVLIGWQAQLGRRLERRLARDYACIWAVSSTDAKYFSELGADTEILPNGAHFASVLPQSRNVSSPFRLLFVGSLGYSANRMAVREAIDWLDSIEGAELWIVGNGALDEETQARVDDARNVHLTGFVDDISQAYVQHDALLVPLREGGGTRLKVLEAMAAGLPVIATEVAVEGIGLTHSVSYLRAEDPKSAAHAVGQLRTREEFRRRLTEEAHQRAADFDWSAIGARARGSVRALADR